MFKRRWPSSQMFFSFSALVLHTFIPLPPISNPHLSSSVSLSALNRTAQIPVRHNNTRVTVSPQHMNNDRLCRGVNLRRQVIAWPPFAFSDVFISVIYGSLSVAACR